MRSNPSKPDSGQPTFGGVLGSRSLFASPSVAISSRSGTIHRPIVYAEHRPIDWSFLYYLRAGTVAIRQSTTARWKVISSNSFFFVRQPSDLILHVARGAVELIVMQWHRSLAVGIDQWLDQAWGRKRGSSVAAYCSSVNTDFGILPILECSPGSDRMRTEMRLLGKIHELMGDLLTQESELCLAPVPAKLPEPIQGLVDAVRQTPAKQWTLKEAADGAGYSLFHFSRTFKHFVGYGFPDYVLRCRAEIAVKLLCNTSKPIETIQIASGFNSVQALREALKEFLGFLPSELRPQIGTDSGQEREP